MPRQYRKISLDQCLRQGFLWLEIWCCAGTVGLSDRCNHRGAMSVETAKARFAGATPIDALPFKCGKCGSRRVDVVPVYREPPPPA